MKYKRFPLLTQILAVTKKNNYLNKVTVTETLLEIMKGKVFDAI